MVAAPPKFYPVVKPGPDPKQTRKVNDLGGKAKDKRTGKLSTLPVWEGYRAFRDPRSPTGWIDNHRVPIVGIDTNGHALRMNLRTGKPEYVDPTQNEGGGVLHYVSKALSFSPFAPDVLGLGLDAAHLEGVNEARAGAGLAATAAIIGAGGFGATTIAGLTGQSGAAGLSTLLGAGGAGGFSSMLGAPAGIVPIPSAPTARAAAAPAGGLGPVVLVAGALVLFLVLRK